MRENVIQQKSYAFASRIVKSYKYLVSEQREFVLSKQLLRSGTSIGANVEEALAASSTADFVHKMNIAAKEARETSYWLRLLHDNDFIPTQAFDSIHDHSLERIRLLASILLTTKNNRSNS
ncbi:four helix bundle protein [Hymenobacter cheonanensis]|uniref:four helix bundle protein n=1 Tax=Hymenobacter sp. CA2-7 TaxID=3063993 RepID=UPI002713624E|nr:four helix bundle protein [Hymenobacter sp. CA2-7]MDO7883726.1 four helix bundle protein [Hymenobacter sp. CA2-7]